VFIPFKFISNSNTEILSYVLEEVAHRLKWVRDVLTPPVWRDRFGAGVLAPTVLAHGRFGAGRFGATE